MTITGIILPIAIIVFALWHIKHLYDEIENLQTENSRLESENFDLELRVHDMERQLCNGKHRWRKVWVFFNQGVPENKFVCGICGKEVFTALDYVKEEKRERFFSGGNPLSGGIAGSGLREV